MSTASPQSQIDTTASLPHVSRGTLRIYLGAAPGVGKTYAMLDEGHRRMARGTDVVIGFVETRERLKTAAEIGDLPLIPRRALQVRGQRLQEMDVDAILARRPALALVDELAHTNVAGSRNEKRWQDVEELLEGGIDVISTLNIQHLGSLNDVVERITGMAEPETIPDVVVRRADQIELVDMTPEALRRRMAHGNVFPPDRIGVALSHFFRVGNLAALRELALLWVADRVDDDLNAYRERHGIEEPWETKERIVVALSGAAEGEHLIRRASRMAARVHGELIGVHVRTIVRDGRARPVSEGLDPQRKLLQELNGQYAEVTGTDVATALVSFARAENATQLVLGHSGQSPLSEMIRGSIINRAIRASGSIDVHVISAEEPVSTGLPPSAWRHRPQTVQPRRLHLGWILGTVGIAALAAALSPFHDSLGLAGALLCLLIGVVATAAVGGFEPAVASAVVGALVADYFFAGPTRGLTVRGSGDVVALVAFFIAAGMMSALVQLSARRALQVTRSHAEVEALARLAGAWALKGGATLPELVAELRRTFDLEGAAILTPDDEGWRLVAYAGDSIPVSPEDAAFSAELDRGTVLVLAGHTLGADDARLVNAFVGQLRLAQERTRLELEAASAAEIARSDRAHTALLAAVSHDLRTPLAAIKAAASSLLSDEVRFAQEDIRSLCETIDAEADRLTNLVANLLDMSRLQAGALPLSVRPTAVEGVLYAAVAALSSVGSGIAIDVAESLPLVQADPGLLERAVANVMANAVAWSPLGTAVRVEAGTAGSRVDIRVIDQGPGIPPNQRDRVFVPFQRRDDGAGGRPNGIGLGLAVAKGFTEAMGGELAVEDTAGGGATLVFSLPRADL